MKTLYQIREYKSPTSYSRPLGVKLRTRWRAIRIISRLHKRDVVMVPVSVNL